MGNNKDLAERFASRVEVTGDHLIWIGNVKLSGAKRNVPRGFLTVRTHGVSGKKYATHVSWFLVHGYWPTQLNHRVECHIPLCVLVDHLYEGNAKQNADDIISNGGKRGRPRKH